jgi:7-cyano-7-deazaguanine synthase in queuosine biosynthesis
LWEKNKDLLQKTLNFLSGDYWSFVFTKRLTHLIRKPLIDIREKRDSVSLLSGGLDSFIGAINLLEHNEKPVFLSWRGGGKTTGITQKSIKQLLINNYKIDKSNFKDFYLSVKGEETTTRTRSFFLFSHAVSLCYEKRTNHKIIVPENGFISLNIPLTEARSGSSSTKTTHPYYLGLLNSLFKGLNIDVEITNPYQFLSKGQMIEKCKNIEFLKKYLKLTVSCSHPDTRGKATQGQCGYCWPCVVRRGAILSSIGYDDTEYTFWNKSSLINYFKTYQLFLSKIENSTNSIIYASGQLNYEDYDKYKKVLYNGCRELEKALIDDEIEKN